MLVLSRKTQESIWIGDNIEIVVAAIQGNRVRLGIRAPSEVPIVRSEISEKIEHQQGSRRSPASKTGDLGLQIASPA